MDIKSVQIQFIQYAFDSNQLQAEDISKMTCKSHESCLARARILLSCLEAGTLPNLVFSNKKKVNIQHHVNPQNDHVWSLDGEIGPQRVTWAQGVASVIVWAAVTKSERSPLVFIEQSIKRIIKMTSLLVHCCPGQKNTSKNVPEHFNKVWHHCTELKRCRSGYQPMFPTSLLKRNGSLHHLI